MRPPACPLAWALVLALAPAAAAARSAPEAVVATEGPAFSIAALPGWTLDDRCGAAEGIPLALYPAGESWLGAARVLYVCTFPRTPERTLESLVADDIEHFRMQSPAARVEEGAPLEARGARVTVREFANDAWGNRETAAYLEAEEGFALVVLSARDSVTHAAGREAFGELVKSLRWVGAGDPQSKLAAALREASQNVQSPEGERFEAAARSALAADPEVAWRECARERSEAEPKSFALLLRVAADGAVEQVVARPETRAAKCLSGKVRRMRMAPPPRPSYWVRMDLAVSE